MKLGLVAVKDDGDSCVSGSVATELDPEVEGVAFELRVEKIMGLDDDDFVIPTVLAVEDHGAAEFTGVIRESERHSGQTVEGALPDAAEIGCG